MQLSQLESALNQKLDLSRRPVAINFFDAPPQGVEKFAGSAPSGCSFWRIAAEGRRFFTVPADHLNCPIGSHTHSIAMSAEKQKELMDTLGFMANIGYVRMEEVGKIPTLPKQPNVIAYAPLSDAPATPDVVIFAGKPAKIMLLMEAAARAGVAPALASHGRPTCMSIPAALSNGADSSTACVGNRVYTEIGDDDLYFAVRGDSLEKVIAELETIVNANHQLREYHTARKQSLSRD
jgi:uncharacterized protein (DUF169 family)